MLKSLIRKELEKNSIEVLFYLQNLENKNEISFDVRCTQNIIEYESCVTWITHCGTNMSNGNSFTITDDDILISVIVIVDGQTL